jgi:hypothetical protein
MELPPKAKFKQELKAGVDDGEWRCDDGMAGEPDWETDSDSSEWEWKSARECPDADESDKTPSVD